MSRFGVYPGIRPAGTNSQADEDSPNATKYVGRGGQVSYGSPMVNHVNFNGGPAGSPNLMYPTTGNPPSQSPSYPSINPPLSASSANTPGTSSWNFENSVRRDNGLPMLPYQYQPDPAARTPTTSSQNFTAGTLRANAPDAPDKVSAGTFADAKSRGMSDQDARRAAYLATHPSGLPPANGGSAQPAASIVDPKAIEAYYTGILHQSHDVMGASQRAGDRKAYTDAQSKYGEAANQLNGFRAMHAGLGGTVTPDGSAGNPFGANYSSSGGQSNLAPTQPAGTVPVGAIVPGSKNANGPTGTGPNGTFANNSQPLQQVGGKAQIPMSEQIARQMWQTIYQQNNDSTINPALNADRLKGMLVSKLGEYGVSPQTAEHFYGNMIDSGTLHTFNDQQTAQPQQPTATREFAGGAGGKSGVWDVGGQRLVLDANGQRVGNNLLPSMPASSGGSTSPSPNPLPTVSGAASATSASAPQMLPGKYRSTSAGLMPGFTPMTQTMLPTIMRSQPQPNATPTPASPSGTALKLSNGRTAYAQADGSVLDESGRMIAGASK